MTEIFDLPRHLREVEDWCKGWNIDFDPSLLPTTGRIISGKAAVFLYKTDSKVCFLENLIRNPGLSQEDTASAVQSCLLDIEEDAKAMGMKLIVCSSDIPSVIKRAKIQGCIPKPKTMLYKELK